MYNAEVLVNLYACVGAWRYLNVLHTAVPGYNSMMAFILLPPIGTAAIARMCMALGYYKSSFSALPFLSVLILAFAADGIFLSVRLLLNRFKRERGSRPNSLLSKTMIFTCLLSWTLCWYIAFSFAGATAWLRPQAFLSVTSIALVFVLGMSLVASIPSSLGPESAVWCTRQVNFVAWLLLLLPFIVVGDLIVIPESLTTWTVPKVLIPIAIRHALSIYAISFAPGIVRSSISGATAFRLFRAIVVTFGCWNVLAFDLHDGAASRDFSFHPLSTLLLIASFCDVVEIFLLGQAKDESSLEERAG